VSLEHLLLSWRLVEPTKSESVTGNQHTRLCVGAFKALSRLVSSTNLTSPGSITGNQHTGFLVGDIKALSRLGAVAVHAVG